MLKRIAVWIVSFWLAGACVARCQSERPLSGVVHGTQVSLTKTGEVPNERAARALPDAPSAVAAIQKEQLRESGVEGKLLRTPTGATSVMLPRATGMVALPRPSAALVYEATPGQTQYSGTFLRKYLEPAHQQNLRYQASSRDSLLGRATDAASRIFLTRDESGQRKVNTPYFVGVLTSIAMHKAERPYWLRSNGVPIGDFGSTVGNDAGMNLLHEFGPGLKQAVTGHMPILARIGERIVRERQSNSPAFGAGR